MEKKSKGVAFLLWLCFGVFGAHKFYLNKTGLGVLYLLTGGICGLGWIIDLFTIWGDVESYNNMSYAYKNPITNTNKVIVNVEKKIEDEKTTCFIDKLKKLAELKEMGALTDVEFNIEKAKLLNKK